VADLRAPPALDRRGLAWRLGRLALLAAIIVIVIARAPGLDQLRARLQRADLAWVVAAAALELGSVAAFAAAFHSALSSRLRRRDSAAIALVAQGVNVVIPAGGTGGLAAAGAIMVRAGIPAAFTASRMVGLFVITSVAVNVLLVIVGGAGVAAGVLPGHGSLGFTLVPAVLAAVLSALVAAWASRPGSAAAPADARWRAIARSAHGYVRDGVRWSGRLIRARDPLLVLGALGYVLFDLAALVGSFRAVGSPGLPLGTLMLAYALGQVGSVASLPGTTEGGLIGAFVLYGTPLVIATSAILLYRAVQSLVPLALGFAGIADLMHRSGAGLLSLPGEGDRVQPGAQGG
jgi:uncharacterized membrane protein YbhN (UPF0104 family)